MSNNKRAAIEVSKERADDSQPEIVTLPYGAAATIVPIPPQLLEEVSSRIKDPEIPIWHNEDKGRDEPNPNDPEYLKAIQQAENDRNMAQIDAMALFGLDLIDGLPVDEGWLRKLKFMDKRGLIDLSAYDLDDDEEREFIYKRFVALNGNVLKAVVKASGISEEEIESVEASFQD